ncbi:MAG: hypothetical protein WCV90_07320 [Candidatus Woesearchaeota archaeon]
MEFPGLIKPYVMVVESCSINCTENTERMGLLLQDRNAANLDTLRAMDLSERLHYAQEHALRGEYNPILNYCWRKVEGTIVSADPFRPAGLEIDDIHYHMGDVLTEQEAFDWGLIYPRVYTICGQIGQLERKNYYDYMNNNDWSLTEVLRERGLIRGDQKVINNDGRTLIANVDYSQWQVGSSKGKLGKDLFASLYIKDEKDHLFVGGAYYVEGTKHIPHLDLTVEFHTTVPRLQ